MDLFSQNISRLCFKANVKQDVGQISLDTPTLNILFALDGRRDVASVSRLLAIPMTELRGALRKLHQHGLIVEVTRRSPAVGSGYIQALESELADIMGPMAGMVLTDGLRQVGGTRQELTVDQADELIEIICEKIPVEDRKKEAFRKKMQEKSRARQP